MVSAIVMGLFIVLGVIGIFRQGLKNPPKKRKSRKTQKRSLQPLSQSSTGKQMPLLPPRNAKNDFRLKKAEENLRIVRENIFQKKRICNGNEQTAYAAALAVVRRRQRQERVLPQVSLGEIITHRNERVYAAVNSKRVDLLVTDAQFNPLVVIEIDGSGHYLANTSHINDAAKSLALRSAGIPLLRIAASDDNQAEIRKLVQKGLEQFFAKQY